MVENVTQCTLQPVEGKWQSLLQSKKRLERERGLAELKVLVEGGGLGEEGEATERRTDT